MTDEIPQTMKRLVVTAPGKDLASCKIEIEEVPVPEPEAGQVLIKVAAAAVNPSDYGAWSRLAPEKCPFVMGNEGCGVVVKVGPGLMTSVATFLTCQVGAKVGFAGLKYKQGTYSEYVIVDAPMGVYPMPADLPIEDAASFFVNPYTAIAILDTVKSEGSKAFVHTAAASQLGQMIVKLAPEENIEVINVVRREEQAEMLKKLGAKHVVVTGSDEAKWKAELKSKIMELDAKVAFDAIAGKMSGDLLDLIPPKGSVYIYGGLAGKAENINPIALIYQEKKLKGFFLSAWMQKRDPVSMFARNAAGIKVNGGLANEGWSSSQFKDTTMENVQADLVKHIESSATGAKLRVRFDTSWV
jgi:NADPH2:quinone reductase